MLYANAGRAAIQNGIFDLERQAGGGVFGYKYLHHSRTQLQVLNQLDVIFFYAAYFRQGIHNGQRRGLAHSLCHLLHSGAQLGVRLIGAAQHRDGIVAHAVDSQDRLIDYGNALGGNNTGRTAAMPKQAGKTRNASTLVATA